MNAVSAKQKMLLFTKGAFPKAGGCLQMPPVLNKKRLLVPKYAIRKSPTVHESKQC